MPVLKLNNWTRLQSIKNQLNQSANRANDLVTALCGGTDIAMTDSTTYTGASGNVYQFIHNINSDEYRIKYTSINDNGSSPASYEFNAFTLDNLLGSSDTRTSVANIINDINDGINTNVCFSKICEVFQGNNKLSISDVYALIDAENVYSEDALKLKEYIRTISSGGSVSSYGLLSVFNSIFTADKESLESGSTIMDSTKPFIIQSLVASVLEISSMVISIVSTALVQLFGAVVMVIGNLISTILSYVSQHVSNDLIANYDSNTYYLNGPVKYCNDYGLPRNLSNSHEWTDNSILYEQVGPFDIYSWRENTTWLSINAFLNIGFDINKAVRRIVTYYFEFDGSSNTKKGRFTSTQGSNDIIQVKRSLYNNPDYYLSPSEVQTIASNPSLTAAYFCACLGFEFLTSFYKSGTGDWDWVEFGSLDITSPKTLTYVCNSSKSEGELYDNSMYARAMITLASYVNNNYTYDYSDFTEGALSNIQSLYVKRINYSASSDVIFCDATGAVSVQNDNHVPTASNINVYNNLCLLSWYKPGDIAGWTSEFDYEYNQFDWTEAIPTDRMFTIPNITTDNVIYAVAGIAATLATLFIAKKVVTKVLQKRTTVKRLNAAKQLATYASLWENNPSQQNYDNYYKAMRRYNFKAKLLGWQTYDPINRWYNDRPDSASLIAAGTAMGSVPTAISNIQSTLTGVNSNTTALETLNTSCAKEVTLSQLYYKIVPYENETR